MSWRWLLLSSTAALAQSASRAHALGVPFAGIPGLLDVVTNLQMERSALSPPIRGDGKLIVGQAPIRTNAAVDKLTELMSVRLK